MDVPEDVVIPKCKAGKTITLGDHAEVAVVCTLDADGHNSHMTYDRPHDDVVVVYRWWTGER